MSIVAIKDDQEKVSNYISVFNDISEKKLAEKKIEHLAYYDTLTGLPNRELLFDRLESSISQAKRLEEKIAVLFIDMDNFKLINDSMGHMVGDVFLKAVAKRIKQCIRDSDTVARFGGDEFVVILNHLEMSNNAAAVAITVLEALKEAFKIETHEIYSSTSMGIAVYPDDGESTVDLIKHADTAMYRAKQSGKDQYQFYTAEMQQAIMDKVNYERELRSAIENRQFELYYQPKIAAKDLDLLPCTGPHCIMHCCQSFDQLKIDRSFVSELPESGQDAAIAKAIITLAHNLGLEVVAEGVETFEQSEFLRTQGCENLQGYYFSKPMPLEDTISYIEKMNNEPDRRRLKDYSI